MILLGRLCRCHYASNPAVSAAVRVACLSPFLGLPRALQAIPLLQAAGPPFWSADFQDSPSPGSPRPLSLCCSLAAHLYAHAVHVFSPSDGCHQAVSTAVICLSLNPSHAFPAFPRPAFFLFLCCLYYRRWPVEEALPHLTARCSFEELPLLSVFMARVISAGEWACV